MSLILLPSQASEEKTFFITGVQKYSTKTGQADYLPPLFCAALALNQAKAQGCTWISISPQGLRPRRYKVADVEAKVRQNPARFKGLVQEPPKTQAEARWQKAVGAYRQKTKSGLLIRDD